MKRKRKSQKHAGPGGGRTGQAGERPEEKVKRKFDINLIMDYRAQIYGVFILWIVLFHAYAIDGVDYTFGFSSLGWLSDILNRGRVGVDGFFFLSGISLYYSWSRDPDIKDYMTKRLIRLFVPVILVDGLYWLIRCVILGQLGGAAGFIRRITLTSFFSREMSRSGM